MRKRLSLLTLVASLGLLFTAQAAALARAQPAPQQGDVVSLTRFAAPMSLGAAKSQLLTYWMPGYDGGMVQATALVFTPMGAAPPGGWPIVAWIHGTTTVGGDQCAPSRTLDVSANPDPDAGYYPYLMTLSLLVQTGHVVVAPDLEGLGTPETYPYYDRRSHALAAIAAVQAAHTALPETSSAWAVVGHSEGGHGAIATAQLASAAGLDYRGGVALAPFDNIVLQFRHLQRLEQAARQAKDTTALTGILTSENADAAVIAAAVKAQDPSFDYAQIMGPDLASEMPDYLSLCIGPAAAETFAAIAAAPDGFAGIQPTWYQQPEVARFLSENDSGELSDLAIKQPLLVLQGDADVVVYEQAVTALVAQLAGTGSPVSFRTYPGAGHDTVLAAGAGDMLEFLKQLFGR